MSDQPQSSTPPAAKPLAKTMDEIVALCRRRGFIFQSSEIYGGINGFWDYGPLGTELKRNLKTAWWEDMVKKELPGPDGQSVDMVGLDCTIIMHPKVWVASGHAAGFNDPMVDCRESKSRYRADHLAVIGEKGDKQGSIYAYIAGDDESLKNARKKLDKDKKRTLTDDQIDHCAFTALSKEEIAITIGPDVKTRGTLTEPRQFNLMFETYVGAVRDEENKAYLRPETAQGIFVNFNNVVNSTRVGVPFGIAQQGKAFRNEVTPRNFTFRSREFEQMEIEFFVIPPEHCKEGELTPVDWYRYWRDNRYQWWQSIGLTSGNLQLREHEKDELAHYAKEGAGTSDIEYRFPFTAPGFGELEGVAHRADFDLKSHAEHSGLRDKMKYYDQERNVRYFPHVIEPSAGADRGTLALICEAFTPDPARPSGVYMKFHPRMAPVKAGIFPLVNKDGMPEVAEKLYRELRKKYVCQYDPKQTIGKRYARMDEAGTPFCFTIDGDTVKDQTVTVRDRDTLQQERIGIDRVGEFLKTKIGE